MKRTIRKTYRTLSIVLMALLAATVLAACVDLDDGYDIIDTPSINLSAAQSVDESSTDDISTPAGYTETPSVTQMVNISPSVVAICGTCEDNSTVYISGGVTDVVTKSFGSYFISEVTLKYEASNLIEITAEANGKQRSLARSIIAYYNATAEKRLDGNSVSVGVDSRLYFDKMVEDSSGSNLYTVSQLKKIQNYVSSTLSAYTSRSGGESVDIVYVLVPNVTTVYPEIYPEGIVKPTNTTIYDQILETLSKTRAKVVDMRKVFTELKADESNTHGIYRVTDSSITDYAAYLMYRETMNVVASRFPASAARGEDEFEYKNVATTGGNLAKYRDLDTSVVNEGIEIMTPKFSLDLGKNDIGETKINSIRKYGNIAEGDYSFFTATSTTDNINGVAERWLVNTGRTDAGLPNALIYRDNCSFPIIDSVAERFDTCMLGKSGDFDINLSNAVLYAAQGKRVTDYIIVFLSEENMDTAFNLAFAE